MTAMHDGRFEDAIKGFLPVIAQEEANPSLSELLTIMHVMLGTCYLSAAAPSKALSHLDRAGSLFGRISSRSLAFKEFFAMHLDQRAKALAALGRSTEAAAAYERVLVGYVADHDVVRNSTCLAGLALECGATEQFERGLENTARGHNILDAAPPMDPKTSASLRGELHAAEGALLSGLKRYPLALES